MNAINHKSVLMGLIAGAAMTATAAVLMGQGASTPTQGGAQYFVTSEGDHEVHLWVREGAKIRCVGHGECTSHADHDHDHKEGDGHAHEEKKP